MCGILVADATLFSHLLPGFSCGSKHLLLGKNKHVTEGHLTLFINTFSNFSQSISNNNDFLLQVTQALP